MTSICQLAAETANHITTPFKVLDRTREVWSSVLARPNLGDRFKCYICFEVFLNYLLDIDSFQTVLKSYDVYGDSEFLVCLETLILPFLIPNEYFCLCTLNS